MDARERERERESQMAHNTQIGLDYGICCRVVLLETQSGVNGADRVDSIKSMGLIRVRREEGGGRREEDDDVDDDDDDDDDINNNDMIIWKWGKRKWVPLECC